MQDDVLVRVEGVSKKFCRNLKRSLWYGMKDMTAEMLRNNKSHRQLRKDEFWAVKDLSFELRRGDCLGLIGHNGAGKSTLLKMLNGLIKPDQGIITMKGRIGALIELGAGFNPVLTGRENVYVNGQILGMSKGEIDKRFDEIIDFSEIRDFIEMPVQNYSSGMKVRLGFAVASQLQPDILLIDEVLAVGDMGFVLKCFNKMDSLLKNTAIILVSHNIPQIARMSTHLLLMSKGKNLYNSADVSSGISKYYDLFSNSIGNFHGDDRVEVKQISLGSNGRISEPSEVFTIEYGHELVISVQLKCKESIHNPTLYIAFYDKEQRVFAEIRNFRQKLTLNKISESVTLSTTIASVQFAQGMYSATLALSEEKDGIRSALFRYQSAVYFKVDGEHHGWAPVQLTPHWEIK